MPEPKFFVWARGRWRELCLSSGRVQGAGGPVRFLYVRGGRLQAAGAPRVLRALRKLASAQPSNAKDGVPLPQRRRVRHPKRSRSGRRHCCCTGHSRQCNTSFTEAPKAPLEAIPLSTTTPHPPRVDIAIQATDFTPPVLAQPHSKDTQPSLLLKSPKAETAQVPPRPRAKRKRSPSPKKRARSNSSAERLSFAALKRREFCKELLINEDDVDLYRCFLIKNDPDFDCYRFDTDEAFKMQFFYRINPLVSLAPCPQLEAMLRRRASQDTISLKDFATKLGLRSISDQEDSDNNKRYKMRRRTKTLVITSNRTEEVTNKENFVQNRRMEAPVSQSKKNSITEKKKYLTVKKKNKERTKALVVSSTSSDEESTNTDEESTSTDEESTSTYEEINKKKFVRNRRAETRASQKKSKSIVEKKTGSTVEKKNKERTESSETLSTTTDEEINKESFVQNRRLETPTSPKKKESIPEKTKNSIVEKKQDSTVEKKQDSTIEKTKNSTVEKKKDSTVDKKIQEVTKNKNKDSPVQRESRNKVQEENKQKPVDSPADRTLRKRLMVAAVQRNIDGLSKSDKNSVNNKSVENKTTNNKKVGVIVVSSPSGSSQESAANKPRFFTKKPTAPKTSAAKLISQTSKSSIGSNKCGGRVYHPREDHAIVAFVSLGDRARRVNGNRLWRDLQEQYHRLTGLSRSWHSLRNRYLRYILPSLGKLALSPSQIARLRANAAKGEIKSRARPVAPEPNPLCALPRVRSAFAAARPPPSPTPSVSPSRSPPGPVPVPASEERALRARRRENADTPQRAPPRRSLRSSGILPPSPTQPPTRPPTRPPTQPPTQPSPQPPSVPQARVRPLMRKLFNPNANTLR